MTHVFLRAAVASTATAQGFCWLNGINRCMQSSDSRGFRTPQPIPQMALSKNDIYHLILRSYDFWWFLRNVVSHLLPECMAEARALLARWFWVEDASTIMNECEGTYRSIDSSSQGKHAARLQSLPIPRTAPPAHKHRISEDFLQYGRTMEQQRCVGLLRGWGPKQTWDAFKDWRNVHITLFHALSPEKSIVPKDM